MEPLNVNWNLHIFYRTTCFLMTLTNLEGHFSLLEPLLMQYCGNVAFGYMTCFSANMRL